MTEERKALLEEAAKHPDETDLRKAGEFGEELLRKAAA
jgi:hypothetical protein